MEQHDQVEGASLSSAKSITALGQKDVEDESAVPGRKRSLRKKILSVIWDSLDKTPEERAFIAKIDWWILSYCCIAYFVKYLDQTNVRNPSPTPIPLLALLLIWRW